MGLTKYKLSDPDFLSLLQKNDIILMCETWSNINSNLHIDNFDHYVVHRKRRSRRAKRDSGGVIAYVKNEISNGVK